MRSHISVHRATTKYFSNSFIFKTKVEKEGLLKGGPAGLGAGGLEFKSPRPDQNISRIFFGLIKAPFTQDPSMEFWQTAGLDSEVVYFPGVRRMTNLQKHEEAGVLYRKH